MELAGSDVVLVSLRALVENKIALIEVKNYYHQNELRICL